MTRAITDSTRLAALQDSEERIKSAFRRGMEATCAIAKELNKVLKGELYKERAYDDFITYVTDYLRMDRRTCLRIIDINQTVDELKTAGLALPSNETQAAELARLEPEKRAGVWSRLILRAEQEGRDLTAEDVRKAVDLLQAAPSPSPRPKPQRTVEIDLDNGQEEPAEKPVKGTVVPPVVGMVLTEKGEAALARIQKLCGEEVAQAIESGAVPLSEKEIRLWADQEDDIIRALSFYVVDARYSVSKGIAQATAPIEKDTDVEKLLLIARSRGGIAFLTYEGAKITVDTNQPK